MDSTLPPVLSPIAFPYSDQPLLNGLPCTIEWTPPYLLQQTVSAIEWTLLLMHSTLPRAIEWTPPYTCGEVRVIYYTLAQALLQHQDPTCMQQSV